MSKNTKLPPIDIPASTYAELKNVLVELEKQNYGMKYTISRYVLEAVLMRLKDDLSNQTDETKQYRK